MSNRIRRLAMLLSGTMVIGLFSGCAINKTDGTEGTEMTETSTQAAEAETPGNPLMVATSAMSRNFSEFFAVSDADRRVADMTAVYLLGKNRNGEYVLKGIEGETDNYNETDYTYYGIADCEVKDQEDGSVTYDFTLRKDIVFSDGKPLTADDLIFSLYVYLDPSYEGSSELNTLPIRGLDGYVEDSMPLYEILLERGEDNKKFDVYTEEQQTQFYETDWVEAKNKFINSILEHYQTDSIADAMIELGYATRNEETGVVTTLYSYVRWSMEDDDVPTAGDFWRELLRNSAYSKKVTEMSADLVKQGVAKQSIFDYLPEYYKNTLDIGKDVAKHISGIEKTGDYSVRITLTEKDTTALSKLAIPVQPLHYYGETELYDYDENQFGFTKGNLSKIKEKTAEPLGAGPYVFAGYENGVAYFEANQHFWKGVPETEYVQFKETDESQMAQAIVEGSVDIAQPSISKSDLEQVRMVNSNGTENGNVISTTFTDYSAFGYIGINGNNVSVGSKPMSEESIALRKAIATVFAFYRFSGVHSYYGDTAEIIQYPVSDASWITPQEWENTFQDAFRYDADGTIIYTSHATLSERKNGVLKAALQYLENAGYKVEDGKVTEAPKGAKLSYEVMITGGGAGDHPSYEVVKSAAAALASIGLELKINDLSDSNEMFLACQTGKAEIWCAAWPQEEPDVYMYSLFHSKGGSQYMFEISSDKLDDLILEARNTTDQAKRKKLYQQCLECIADYAVVIPVYQRQDCTLYSSERLNMSSVAKDQTSNYDWMDEIYLIQTK